MLQKTFIPLEIVNDFLQKKYTENYSLKEINSGDFSSAFLLEFPEKTLVLRINADNNHGFVKDEFINTLYKRIPVPVIIENGQLNNNYFYSISEYIKGRQLNQLNDAENGTTLFGLFAIMNVIHTSIVPQNEMWDKKNWIEILENYANRDYKKNMPAFFSHEKYQELLTTFNDKKNDLENYSYLIHGDFGRTNIFAEKNQIVGVIDWSESMLGDFVWDLAWLAFWSKNIDYVNSYYEFNKDNKKLDMKKFTERFQLYSLVIGIHTLLFSADRNDEQTYLEALERINRFGLHNKSL